MFDAALLQQAEHILQQCRDKQLTLATAESCTGGLLAALFTEIPGSSDVFAGGVVTYSNELKQKILQVPEALLAEHGAVSEPVAQHMASGMQRLAAADIAISVTGIAGPGGGSDEKPVGLVYIGLAVGDNLHVTENHFTGSRSDIRLQTVAQTLIILQSCVFN